MKDIVPAMIWLAIIIVVAFGWINNIIILAHMSFADFDGMMLLRAAGIFVAPLGAVLGYV